MSKRVGASSERDISSWNQIIRFLWSALRTRPLAVKNRKWSRSHDSRCSFGSKQPCRLGHPYSALFLRATRSRLLSRRELCDRAWWGAGLWNVSCEAAALYRRGFPDSSPFSAETRSAFLGCGKGSDKAKT